MPIPKGIRTNNALRSLIEPKSALVEIESMKELTVGEACAKKIVQIMPLATLE
jgi:hypothetical protein